MLFWIFNNTGKSVLAAAKYYAADNTELMLMPNFQSIVPLEPLVQSGFTLFATLWVALLWDSSSMTRFRFGAGAKATID